MYYPATIIPYDDGSGQYAVVFPDLPGCTSCGKNIDHALHMAAEALSAHVGGMLEDGEDLPSPSTLDKAREAYRQMAYEANLCCHPGALHQFVHFEPHLSLNMPKPTEITITLPRSTVERMDFSAEKLGLDRSGLVNMAINAYCNSLREKE